MLCCLSAAAAAEIRGKVVDPDGKAAPGAKVKLYYSHDASGYGSRWLSEATADAQGVFSVAKVDFDPPAILLRPNAVMRCYLVAVHPGHAVGVAEVIPGEDEGYTITLEKGRKFTCTVLDQAGARVKDAEVTVRLVQGFGVGGGMDRRGLDGLADLLREVYRGKTDENGKLVIDNLPTGTVSLRAAQKEKGMGFTLAPEGANDVTLTLTGKFLEVRGKATCADTGKPAAGMVVCAQPQWQRDDPWFTTDAEGNYEASLSLPAGRMGMAGTALLFLDPRSSPSYAVMAAPIPHETDALRQELNIRLAPGWQVSGKVVDPATGQAVPGAVVAATVVPGDGQTTSLYRVCDKEGQYRFRVAVAAALDMSVLSAPQGYVAIGGRGTTHLEVAGDVANANLGLEVVPEALLPVLVKNPDGKPCAGAQIFLRQPVAAMTSATHMADGEGKARLSGLAQGRELNLYVISRDGTAAASVNLPPLAKRPAQPVEIALRPARTGEILLQDVDGNKLSGFVSVHLAGLEGQPGQAIAQGRVDEQAADKTVRVGGLLPGVEYVVRGFSPGNRPADNAQWTQWRFGEEEQNPKLLLRFQRQGIVIRPVPAPGGRGAPTVRTDQDFKHDLETLKDAVWKKEDPVQKNLTWYAEKQGLAVADSESKEIKRFKELLGFQNIVCSGVAFAADKVWVATDKGLFAWDRKDQYWSLFAVGALYVDVPVREISFTDGKLRVTIQQPGKNPRQFEYDTASGKWQELR
jgi:hypothetical protein